MIRHLGLIFLQAMEGSFQSIGKLEPYLFPFFILHLVLIITYLTTSHRLALRRFKWWKLPEQQAQDGEGADVDSGTRDGGEDAAHEARQDEGDGLPDAEVLDLVVSLTLVLPENRVIGIPRLIIARLWWRHKG